MSEAEVLVRRVMEAHNRGGDAVVELFDDVCTEDFEFRPVIVGSGGGSATYRGREGMVRYYQDRAEVFEGGEVHIRSAETFGDAVVLDALSTARGRASGAQLEEDITLVYWCRDGRLTRGQAFRSREHALEAARA